MIPSEYVACDIWRVAEVAAVEILLNDGAIFRDGRV